MPLLTSRERIRTMVGGYRVERIIATGGMGVVFEARQPSLNEVVALKLPRVELDENEHRGSRLRQEAAAMMRLGHPNIVRVLGARDTEDGLPYLVMERLQGRTLEVVLTAQGRLDVAECLLIVLPIMGALATVHDAGLVHRDLKPRNIFVARSNGAGPVPKLLDFGIAKGTGTSLTQTGCAVGTPSYMAPEQRAARPVGPAADVFSMGVVLYRTISGALPQEGDAGAGLGALQDVLPGGAPEFAAAVMRAIRARPEDRYASMRAFAQALVATSVADGIALPSDPDPIGLPEYADWLRAAREQGSTVGKVKRRVVRTDAAAGPSPTTVSETTGENATAIDVPRSRSRRGLGAAAVIVSVAAVAAAVAVNGGRHPVGADEDRAPEHAMPSEAEAVAVVQGNEPRLPSGRAASSTVPSRPLQTESPPAEAVPIDSFAGAETKPGAAVIRTQRVAAPHTPPAPTERTGIERKLAGARSAALPAESEAEESKTPLEPRLRVEWE